MNALLGDLHKSRLQRAQDVESKVIALGNEFTILERPSEDLGTQLWKRGTQDLLMVAAKSYGNGTTPPTSEFPARPDEEFGDHLRRENHPRGRANVAIELGAGVGLASMALARMGCVDRVIATDRHQVIPGLQKNLDANGFSSTSSNLEVFQLDWATDAAPLPAEVEKAILGSSGRGRVLVVGSECVYDPKVVPQLVAVVTEMLRCCRGIHFIFSFSRPRPDAERVFLKELIVPLLEGPEGVSGDNNSDRTVQIRTWRAEPSSSIEGEDHWVVDGWVVCTESRWKALMQDWCDDLVLAVEQHQPQRRTGKELMAHVLEIFVPG